MFTSLLSVEVKNMIKIKFNNKENFEDVEFSRTEHLVTLKGITEVNNSGFKTYRMSGEQLGDFSDYTTTYRILDDEVQYSNDGSVWVEPTPYEPTVDDEINALKKELESTDYKIIKCSEYQLASLEPPYDISELHSTRQALRDRINEMEE